MVDKKVETPSDADEVQLPSSILKLPTSPKVNLPRFKLGRSASQKETEANVVPPSENVAAPPTPITESSEAMPTVKATDHKSEGVHFPFDVTDARESRAASRPPSRPGSRPVSPGPATALLAMTSHDRCAACQQACRDPPSST